MLTKKMQIQAVVDRLHGLPTTLTAANLAEPWRTCWQALDGADPQDGRQALILALQENDDRDAILGAIFTARPGQPLGRFLSLQEMDEAGLIPDIQWLWPNWIPAGMLSLLTAYGGAGKSIVALDLARRIIEDRTYPDGAPVIRPGATVVYVDAEMVPQMHNVRAQVWGMDRSQLFLMLPEPDELFIDLNNLIFQDRLVEMVATVNPSLVVVDSLSTSSMRGVNAKEDVLEELGFLNRVALEFRCAVLLIHHLRKPGSGAIVAALSQHDVMGSAHIVNASRSVMGLSIIQTGPTPDKNGPRRLEVLKTNLVAYPEPIGLEFVSVHPNAPELRYGRAPEPYESPTKADSCADWLFDLLEEQGEAMRPKEIVELAKEAGYSRSVVYQARELLEGQIVNTSGKQAPNNRWALAEWNEEEC